MFHLINFLKFSQIVFTDINLENNQVLLFFDCKHEANIQYQMVSTLFCRHFKSIMVSVVWHQVQPNILCLGNRMLQKSRVIALHKQYNSGINHVRRERLLLKMATLKISHNQISSILTRLFFFNIKYFFFKYIGYF